MSSVISYLLKHEDWAELKKILTRIAEAIERLCDEVECLPRGEK